MIQIPEIAAASFKLGQAILLPNGAASTVAGVDTMDDEILDACGGWHPARDVEAL